MSDVQNNLLWQAFATSRDFLDIFSKVALEDGLPVEAVTKGCLDLAIRTIKQTKPKVIFLEERTEIPASSYASLGSYCKLHGIGLVLMGLKPRIIRFKPDQNLSGLTFKQMAAFGVNEYLSLPLTAEDIRLCFGAVLTECKNHQEQLTIAPTKTILFAGVQGGVGASSLCANYASVLALKSKKNCLILDFDWSCSNLWINFGVEKMNTFSNLLSDPSRIDGALIESSVRKLQDNLYLLSDYTSRAIDKINSTSLDYLLKGIDGRYDYVLVDCPIYQQDLVIPLLAYANYVYLVTDLTQPSLSMLKSLLGHSGFQHMFGSMHLAINNREPEKNYTLEDEDFLESYDFVDHVELPYCKGSMQEAMLEGQVLAEYDEGHKYIKLLIEYMIKQELLNKTPWYKKFFGSQGD